MSCTYRNTKIDEIKRQIAAAASAENPWYFSNFTIPIPTVFIILKPPAEVPMVIIRTNNHKPDRELKK